jgi:hypothetical protein
MRAGSLDVRRLAAAGEGSILASSRRKSVCHGPAVTPSQSPTAIAPCGKVIRLTGPGILGDSQSSSTRYINCPKCLRLGEEGVFRLIRNRLEQLIFPAIAGTTPLGLQILGARRTQRRCERRKSGPQGEQRVLPGEGFGQRRDEDGSQ